MKLTVCHMQGVLDHVTLTASFTQFTFYKVCFPTLALMGLFMVALSHELLVLVRDQLEGDHLDFSTFIQLEFLVC